MEQSPTYQKASNINGRKNLSHLQDCFEVNFQKEGNKAYRKNTVHDNI